MSETAQLHFPAEELKAPPPHGAPLLDRTAPLLALFLAVGLIVFVVALLTVHARDPAVLPTNSGAIRSNWVLSHWLDEGYFHYFGMTARSKPGEKVVIYRTSTGGYMLSTFIVEKFYGAFTGRYSWRLVAWHNQVVTLLLSAMLGLLAFRLTRRIGLDVRTAFAAGACVVIVVFTFPDNLGLYWEMSSQAYALLFATIFLLLEERSVDGGRTLVSSIRARRSAASRSIQAMIVFERRASAIVYNLLRSRRDPRPYLMPANVCPVVPETFVEAGQPFELVDITEPWLTIDGLDCFARMRAQSRGYAGLLFVRPYGSERDPSGFFAGLKATQPDILIIDDKCLCRPDCDAASLAPEADVTLFSSGHAKYADVGGGGFAHVPESVVYARAGTAPAGWLDCRPPDTSWNEHRRRTIDAAFAADAHKRTLNAIYERALPRTIRVPDDLQRWRFNIRVPAPDRLIESAFACGLFASRHYPPYSAGDFPIATRVSNEIVNLFNDRYFGEEQAGRMAELVLRHLERH